MPPADEGRTIILGSISRQLLEDLEWIMDQVAHPRWHDAGVRQHYAMIRERLAALKASVAPDDPSDRGS
jgi:hypothetical protein